MKTVLNLLSKEDCCGCEACANVCPVSAIIFKPDSLGFRYPFIDNSKCIQCGKCANLCPALNNKNNSINKEMICGYSKEEDLVQKSSSGGFFSLISNWFLNNGGCVVGVKWADDFRKTEHYVANNKEEFEKIVGSKYFQSQKNNIYKDVIKILKEGKKVLFSGCPCEVAALKLLVDKSLLDNLYTIDLVCQGPSTTKALVQYIDMMERKHKAKVTHINMRVPIGVWIPQHMLIRFSNGKEYLNRLYDTPFGDAVRIIQRKSCYSCRFAGGGRKSDLTLGDYHGAKKDASYYHESGVSVALSHSNKGDFMLDILKNENIYYENCDYETIAKKNPRIEKPWNPLPEYQKFSELFSKTNLFNASKKTLSLKRKIFRKIPLKTRIKIENKMRNE